MKLVRSWPFLTLAVVTLAVGVLWHLAGVARDDGVLGRLLFGAVSVLGAPFIAAQRLSRTLGDTPLRPAIALLLGLAPYVLADLLLRRRRLRTRATVN
jgi:hypothetical protein